MLLVEASVRTDAPAPAAWRAVIDWPGQARWIPLTTVRVRTGHATGLGVRVEAFSGFRLGPLRLGLLDRFVVTGWREPGADGGPAEVEVLHLGPGFTGVGTIRVLSVPGGSIIAVTESFLPPGGAVAAPLVRPFVPLLRAGLSFSLRRLARLLSRELP